ncbi:MAG: hypothetical protein SNJ78_07890 [Spirochaetales bacterium]
MKKRMGGILIFTLWAFIFGCSKEAFFGDPAPSEPEVKVLSLSEGAVLSPSAEIPLSLSLSSTGKKKDLSEPYTLIASIQTTVGEEVASVSIPSIPPESGPLPSLVPPPLQRGSYILVLSLKQGQIEVYQKKIPFFVELGSYTLERFSLYPPSVPPASNALLQVVVQKPEQSDPWLRWTIQGRVVQEKLLSEGGAEVSWISPEKEGVYPVRVDLYPFQPKDSFPSPVFLTAQLIVSNTVGVQENDFSPEESYWSLFHFMGNLRDSGSRKDKLSYKAGGGGNLAPLGSPRITLKNRVFGYYLEGESGFGTDQLLLPLPEKERTFTWTIQFRLRPEAPLENRTWFETRSSDGLIYFRIGTQETGALKAQVKFESVLLEFPSNTFLQVDTTYLVEFSLSIEVSEAKGIWTLNGQAEPPIKLPVEIKIPALQGEANKAVRPDQSRLGKTWIGRGEQSFGFVGVLDEFGILYIPSSSPSTVTASTSPSVSLQKEGTVSELDTGFVLSPGAGLLWAGIPWEGKALEFELPVDLSSFGAKLVFNLEANSAGSALSHRLAEIHYQDGVAALFVKGSQSKLPLPEVGVWRLSLEQQKESLLFRIQNTEVRLRLPSIEFESITIRIQNPKPERSTGEGVSLEKPSIQVGKLTYQTRPIQTPAIELSTATPGR